jgi:DNA-binding CsgD family transcriptional regulator/tetratricopeptide (TPR) repeat protein
MVSPLFVGRAAELGQLRLVLEAADSGRAGVALVAGEAGIGKSRLVREALSVVGRFGARALIGECCGFAPGSLPYEPILHALRQLDATDAETARAELATATAVHRLLPELAPQQSQPILNENGSAGQGALFAQLVHILESLASDKMLVLVIEDLHWADLSTLQFLSYLAHELRSQRIALIGTYRDDDTSTVPALGGWLADQWRDPRLIEIALARFTQAELAEQVTAILDRPPERAHLADLHRRCGGNPYFAEMIVASGNGDPIFSAPGSASLPARLRDVLLARVAETTAPTRRVLDLLAVLGHPCSHAHLRQASHRLGVNGEGLLVALREGVSRHLLVTAETSQSYVFRHALLGEAIYDSLLPGERARAHAVWSDVLERTAVGSRSHDANLLAEIAVHHHRAGHRRAAIGWDLRAATAAELLGGFAEAAQSYLRLLAVWSDVDEPARLAGIDRAEVLTRLGQVEELAGDVSNVVKRFDEALALVDRKTDPVRVARLLDQRCWSLHIAGQPATGLAAARAAVRLVPDSPPTLDRVVVLAGLARINVLLGVEEDAESAAAAATRAALQLEDPLADALVAQVRGRVAWLIGSADVVHSAQHALRVSMKAAVPAIIMINFDGLAEALDAVGDDQAVLKVCFGGYERTRRYGGWNYGSWLLCRSMRTLVALGRIPEAEEALRMALQVPPSGILAVYQQLSVALLATLRGDFSTSRVALAECRRIAPEPRPFARLYCQSGADTELWAGNPDHAFLLAEEGLASVAGTGLERYSEHLPWLAHRAAADRAEAARAHADPASLSAAVADAERLRGLRMTPARYKCAFPRPLDTELDAAISAEESRLAGHSDPDAWAAAARIFTAHHRPQMAGYATWRQGEALLRTHAPRALIADTLRGALEMAQSSGAAPLQREITTLAGLARLHLQPAPRPPTPTPSLPTSLRALTRREVEVLRRLVAGETNRQIAASLFISPRTAAVHVSSVLRKLGVGDRVAAAQLARQVGGFADAGAGG